MVKQNITKDKTAAHCQQLRKKTDVKCFRNDAWRLRNFNEEVIGTGDPFVLADRRSVFFTVCDRKIYSLVVVLYAKVSWSWTHELCLAKCGSFSVSLMIQWLVLISKTHTKIINKKTEGNWKDFKFIVIRQTNKLANKQRDR